MEPPDYTLNTPGLLVCRLVPASLYQEKEYEAISYAWGEPESSSVEKILCNGIPFIINSNLAAALRKLRFPDQERALWADAICINQADFKEKASQVPIMRHIYENARQVIVWLGEEEDGDRDALRLLHWMSWYFDKQNDEMESGAESAIKRGWNDIKHYYPEEFRHLTSLLRREWFNRTWVVQEVASPQNAILKCGYQSLDWEVVADVFMKLRDTSLTVDHMEDSEFRHVQENIVAMETARRSVNGTSSLSLFELLLATCSNDCSNFRDKIFELLGLAKDWLEKGGLEPDYRPATTAEEIFKRFAIWDVKNGKIRILSCSTGSNSTPNLPSWAPNWRNIQNPSPFVRYSDRTKFSASKDTLVDAWCSDHGTALNTIGEIVDSLEVIGAEPKYCRITDILPITRDTVEKFVQARAWLQERELYAGNSDSGEMTSTRYEQFWRTMTCGLTGDGYPAPSEYGGYFKEYLEFIQSEVPRLIDAANKSGEETSPNSPIVITRLSNKHPNATGHTLIESSLEKWAAKRRFCTTTRGRLGFVPTIAQRGDLICILYGGEVPYLLRPQSSNSYIVLGECYVDGIMHGEALTRDSLRTKRFKLVTVNCDVEKEGD